MPLLPLVASHLTHRQGRRFVDQSAISGAHRNRRDYDGPIPNVGTRQSTSDQCTLAEPTEAAETAMDQLPAPALRLIRAPKPQRRPAEKGRNRRTKARASFEQQAENTTGQKRRLPQSSENSNTGMATARAPAALREDKKAKRNVDSVATIAVASPKPAQAKKKKTKRGTRSVLRSGSKPGVTGSGEGAATE
ncbi:hypothetical protein K440DRAFT_681384 [Wilcoxina mikolae CBS 423.85]|nr:hypothetical protein K440DRAFT_681384 [Wilcoxina mikolae CBS 423.85]